MLSDQTREYGNLTLCYVDDILVATSTVDQHLEQFQIVFAKLLGAQAQELQIPQQVHTVPGESHRRRSVQA